MTYKTILKAFLVFFTSAFITNASSTCWTEVRQTSIRLQNCSLTEWPLVTCYVIGQAESVEDLNSSPQFLFNITFLILTDDTTNLYRSTQCIRLHSISLIMDKRYKSSYIQRFQLPSSAMRLAKALRHESYMNMKFNKIKNVGFVEVTKTLDDTRRQDAECTINVDIGLLQWNSSGDPFALLFKEYMHSFGAHLNSMRLDFDPYIVSKVRLERLSDLLKHHNETEELRILHGDWIRVESDPWSMPKLIRLELSWDHIEHISEGWLSSLKSLTHLSLAHNNLKTVPEDINILENLNYIDLSFNPLLFNDGRLYTRLSVLGVLNISLASTPISTLRELLSEENRTSPVLFSEINVPMCNISLSFLDNGIFESQYILEILNLSHNVIEIVPPTLFANLTKLRILDLSFNKLTIGPKLELCEYTNLHSLELSGNAIADPSNIVVKGNVTKLNLSYNNIATFENPKAFSTQGKSNPWVEHINLSHNIISVFSEDMLDALSQITTVDLGANYIDCYECRIRDFQLWLASTNSVLNLGSSDDLVCSFPEGFHGSHYQVMAFQLSDDRCYDTSEIAISAVFGVILATCATLLAFALFVTIICYTRRYDFSYSVHLLAIKKKWNSSFSKAGLKYDAYISYSEEDRDWVMFKLVKGLEGPTYNLKISLRHRDIILGSPILDGVMKLIYNSRNTVVVLSHNYVDSQWCRAEMEHVRRAGHNMVLLEKEQLERWRLSREIRFLMDTRTYLSWHDGEATRVAEALLDKIHIKEKGKNWLHWFKR